MIKYSNLKSKVITKVGRFSGCRFEGWKVERLNDCMGEWMNGCMTA